MQNIKSKNRYKNTKKNRNTKMQYCKKRSFRMMMMMMITDASRSQSAGVAPGDHLRVIYPG